MNYYHGEINTPVERHINIYVEETDYQFAEWKVWNEAKIYGICLIAERGTDYDEQEFVDECEGWIIDQITDEEYHAAMMREEWCV